MSNYSLIKSKPYLKIVVFGAQGVGKTTLTMMMLLDYMTLEIPYQLEEGVRRIVLLNS